MELDMHLCELKENLLKIFDDKQIINWTKKDEEIFYIVRDTISFLDIILETLTKQTLNNSDVFDQNESAHCILELKQYVYDSCPKMCEENDSKTKYLYTQILDNHITRFKNLYCLVIDVFYQGFPLDIDNILTEIFNNNINLKYLSIQLNWITNREDIDNIFDFYRYEGQIFEHIKSHVEPDLPNAQFQFLCEKNKNDSNFMKTTIHFSSLL